MGSAGKFGRGWDILTLRDHLTQLTAMLGSLVAQPGQLRLGGGGAVALRSGKSSAGFGFDVLELRAQIAALRRQVTTLAGQQGLLASEVDIAGNFGAEIQSAFRALPGANDEEKAARVRKLFEDELGKALRRKS